MFRFSVLLAFLFAALFGPSKATPVKKKNLRRRIEAPQPVVANALAAVDTNQPVFDDTAVHMRNSDSDSESGDDGKHRRRRRRRRKKGKNPCRHCKTKHCRRKCRKHLRRRGSDHSGSDNSGSDHSGSDGSDYYSD